MIRFTESNGKGKNRKRVMCSKKRKIFAGWVSYCQPLVKAAEADITSGQSFCGMGHSSFSGFLGFSYFLAVIFFLGHKLRCL